MSYTHLGSQRTDVHIFKKSKNQVQILGTRRVAQSRFQTEDLRSSGKSKGQVHHRTSHEDSEGSRFIALLFL